jgi:hypothetical protein
MRTAAEEMAATPTTSRSKLKRDILATAVYCGTTELKYPPLI